MSLSAESAARLHLAQLPRAEVEALYVHVPFCFHKCHYCDFYSITRQTPERMERFVELILREADLWSPAAARPRTIFFGGGTPTLLSLDAMQRLLEGLRSRFDLSAVGEWTIEANPATVTAEYCRMLRAAGVDRLSFGAQSFSREELSLLERHHEPPDVARSVQLARDAGYSRLSLDLIYAIPGQSFGSWADSLEQAIALGTSHLSCYGLTYEPNTPIAVRKRLGQLTAGPEVVELDMLRHARQRLSAAGLPPYEISNYAAPGQECRHNLVYWTGGSYIGLGPSAASHIAGTRFRNRPHLGEWEQSLDRGELSAIDIEHLDARTRAAELAWLMLRLDRGIDFTLFTERLALDARVVFSDLLDRLDAAGLIALDTQRARLTPPGIEVADAVAVEFLRQPSA